MVSLFSRLRHPHKAAQPNVLPGPHLIVGLGNPGAEYANTRHNAGFKVLDALAAHLGATYWKLRSNAQVTETTLNGEKIVLAKPQTFMNLSGNAVKGLCTHYGFAAADVLVIHDELDLPEGEVRLKVGGGHAGHNGLRSLHEKLGANYNRLRIGIGRPPGQMPAARFVLQEVKGSALAEFEVTVQQAVPPALSAIKEGMTTAMCKYN